MNRFLPFVFAIGFVAGCAGLEERRTFTCSYDTVWDATVEALKSYPVTSRDKISGVIETGWVEVASKERGFGIFQRDAFDNKERARMTVTVDRHKNGSAAVVVSEQRQRWHVRGGVTQLATKWMPVEPSEEAMAGVLDQVDTKLKDRGCPST